MKIGVLSDTHIPRKAKVIPEIVIRTFKGVDHIVHAGDIMSVGVLDELSKLAAITAVAGNTDSPELFEVLGEKKMISFDNFRFGVTHGHGKKGKTKDRAIECFRYDAVDCIIFGHSHIPCVQYYGNILLFNPGSCTDKRRNRYFSFGMIEISEKISPLIYYFDGNGLH